MVTNPWIAQLDSLDGRHVAAFLTCNSGLPGPRANLELADAFAVSATDEKVLDLVHSDDEYLRFCGTEAIGAAILRHPEQGAWRSILSERATDDSWRVREGAARAVQLIGDADTRLMTEIATAWLGDDSPLVIRAAIAAICEPRLLKDETAAAFAIAACVGATDSFGRLRSNGDARVLRQALGYCWSVAIAAAPEQGLAAFGPLRASADPDIRWIVASNEKKARYQRAVASRSV